MLGNFSFGDYFKADAIPLGVGVLHRASSALDPDRLWVTVHETDDEAERDLARRRRAARRAHPAPRRRQLLAHGRHRPVRAVVGDLLGSRPRARRGRRPGAATRTATSRSGTSCSCSSTRSPTARSSRCRSRASTPAPASSATSWCSQGVDSIWDIDVFRPLIAAAERGDRRHATGGPGGDSDVSLRILAEHARTMTFLVSDGVVPSNEERGYVLRRIIRRAVRHAYLLGAADVVTPALVDATVESMGERVPRSRQAPRRHRERRSRARRSAFRQTLQRGLDLLDGAARRRRRLRRGGVLPARHARLPDRPHPRDRRGARPRASTTTASRARMDEQRTRAREARQGRRREGVGAPSSCTASSSTTSARPSSPAATSTRRPTPRCWRSSPAASGSPKPARATRSTSSSTARRSTRSPAVRSATPARIATGDGRTQLARRSTRSTASPARSSAPGRSRRAASSPRATASPPRSTPSAATASAATTPRPTSCTGRCARCSART